MRETTARFLPAVDTCTVPVQAGAGLMGVLAKPWRPWLEKLARNQVERDAGFRIH